MKKFLLILIISSSLNVFISCDDTDKVEYTNVYLTNCGYLWPCQIYRCYGNGADTCGNYPADDYDCRKDNICLKYSSDRSEPISCNEEDGNCYNEKVSCSSHDDCIGLSGSNSDSPKYCCDLAYEFCSTPYFCIYNFKDCSNNDGCISEQLCRNDVIGTWDIVSDNFDCRDFNYCEWPFQYNGKDTHRTFTCNETDGKCYIDIIQCEEDIDCANSGYPELVCNKTAGKCEDPPE